MLDVGRRTLDLCASEITPEPKPTDDFVSCLPENLTNDVGAKRKGKPGEDGRDEIFQFPESQNHHENINEPDARFIFDIQVNPE